MNILQKFRNNGKRQPALVGGLLGTCTWRSVIGESDKVRVGMARRAVRMDNRPGGPLGQRPLPIREVLINRENRRLSRFAGLLFFFSCFMLAAFTLQADYTVAVRNHEDGTAVASVPMGQNFSLDVILTSDGADEHDANAFSVEINTGDLVYEGYSWASPFSNNSIDDLNEPALNEVPVAVDTISISNLTDNFGESFGTGTIITLNFSIPLDYTGPLTVSFAPVISVIDGFQINGFIPVPATPDTTDFTLTVIPVYELQVVKNIDEAGVVTGDGLFNEDTEAPITANANSGYRFTGWSEDAGDFSSSDASTTVTMNDDRVIKANFTANSAPVATDLTIGVAEDSSAGIVLSGTDVNNDSLTFTVTGDPSHGQLTGSEPNLTYTPDPDYFGPDSFSYKANDSELDSLTAGVVTINVTGVQDAPVADPKSAATLEDSSVSITLSGSDLDEENLDFTVTTYPSKGTLSGSGANLTYTPDSNLNGPDSFQYVANDGTEDSDPVTVSIAITAVNDAPSFTGKANVGRLEDSDDSVEENWATSISPGPTDEIGQSLNFSVISNDNPGLFSSGPTMDGSGNMSFVLVADANGSANVMVVLGDDGGTDNGGDATSDPFSVTITVTEVNDAPSFTGGADVPVLEDSGEKTVAGWASDISSGPSNESTQNVMFSVMVNDNPELFSVAPAVSSDGTLTFTPATDEFGSADITIHLLDDGGVSDGGSAMSSGVDFTISVTPVNDRPSLTPGGDIAVKEDAGPQAASGWAADISEGPENESAQTVAFALTDNTNPELFSQEPSIDDTGTLTFESAADANGQAVLSFRLSDDGGTENGGEDTADVFTVNVTISAVNDPPSFTAGDDQTVLEDDDPQTIAWATGISAGADNESADQLTFLVTTNNDALFSALPAIDSSGVLTFTPALDANGSATVSVVLKDDGGTDLSGWDSSPLQTFEINVSARNDLPSAAAFSVSTNEDTPYWFTSNQYGFSDVDDGDYLARIRVTKVPDNGALRPYVAQDDLVDGDYVDLENLDSLIYTPLADQNGAPYDTFEFQVVDGSDGHSIEYTVTINVSAVQDAPTAQSRTIAINEDEPFAFVADDFGFHDVDTGDTLVSVTIASFYGGGSLDLDLTPVVGGTTIPVADIPGLVFTPAENENGSEYAQVNFSVSDGSDDSGSHYISFNVTPVNDCPVPFTDNPTTGENTSLTGNVLSNDTDVDNDPLTVVAINGFSELVGETFTLSNGAIITVDSDGNYELIIDGRFEDLNDGEYSSDQFSYTVSDGSGDCNPIAYFSFSVTGTNDCPQATDDTIYLTEDSALSGSLTGNDYDPDDLLTITEVNGNPAIVPGSLELSAGGWMTIDTYGDFSVDTVGYYDHLPAGITATSTFTYTLSDGHNGCDSMAHVSVVVTGVNDLPTSGGISTTTAEDTPFDLNAGDFSFSDADDGSTFAGIVVTRLPAGGSLTLSGQPVVLDSLISYADLAASEVNYSPDTDGFGEAYDSFEFKVSDGLDLSSLAYTYTINVEGSQDSPTADSKSIVIDEDTSYTFSVGDFGYYDADGDPIESVTLQIIHTNRGQMLVGATPVYDGMVIPVSSINDFVAIPVADEYGDGYFHFNFTVSDGFNDSSPYFIDISVSPVNDCPVVTDESEVTGEDIDVMGNLLINDTDVDNGSLNLLSVNGDPGLIDQTFSLDSGAIVLVEANGMYSITVNGYYDDLNVGDSVSDSFTYTVGDGSDNCAVTGTVYLTVTGINDCPEANDDTLSSDEDSAFTGNLLVNDSDPDDTIVIVTVNGDAVSDYVNIPMSGDATLHLSADGFYSMDPVGYYDYLAAGQWETQNFTYTLSDGSINCAPVANVTVIITGVNDLPVANPDVGSVIGDVYTQVYAPGILENDTDIDDGTQLFVTEVNGNAVPEFGVAVTLASGAVILVMPDGSYTYEPNHAFNFLDEGEAEQDVINYVTSDGLASAASALTMTITGVNDAPTGTDDTITIDEDQSHAFSAGDFGFNDEDTGDSLVSVEIITWSGSGSLTYDGSSVPDSLTLLADDLGLLVFSPIADDFGGDYARIEFLVSDGDAVAVASNTISIDVNPVNDVPSFTRGDYITTAEDSGMQSISNWATDLSPGPANESAQALTFSVVNNTNTGLFSTLPSIDPNGTLTFESEENANGVASITIQLLDNGGTDNGGVDSSDTQQFFITINDVNDPPSFTKGDDVYVNEDSGPQSFVNWATNLNTGASDESSQELSFSINSNTNSGLFSSQPSISSDGTLTFTANDGANGSATISIRLSDSGGTDLGGSDTSVEQAFVITVNPVNDPPVNTQLPLLPSIIEEGDFITVTPGLWNDTVDQTPGNISLTYVWQKADDASGTNLFSFSDLTSPTFTAGDSVAGQWIRVQETATDDGEGTPSSQSITVASAWHYVTPVHALSIDSNPAEGGTTTGAGDYAEGTVVSISATAAEGYLFVSWTGATVADADSSVTTVTVNADVSLTANFELDKEIFDAWGADYFTPEELADPLISGPAADPYNTGLPNLLCFAFDMDPHNPDRSKLPDIGLAESNGHQFLTLTFYLRPNITGVTINIIGSTNLSDSSVLDSITPTETGGWYTFQMTESIDVSAIQFLYIEVVED